MLILAIFVLVSAQDCTFTLPGGEVVNLSSMRNSGLPDYEITSNDGYIYRANICGSVNSACEGDTGGIASQWFSYSTCIASLGRMYDYWGTTIGSSVGYLDASDPSKGFFVSYQGGDICFDMNSYVDRSVTFNFHCDSSKDTLTDAYETSTYCKYALDFNTKLACIGSSKSDSAFPTPAAQTQGLSSGSKFLIFLFIGTLLYCGLGIAYNKYTTDATLLESIPQKEFWMEVPSLAADGMSYSVTKVKVALGSIKGQSHEPI